MKLVIFAMVAALAPASSLQASTLFQANLTGPQDGNAVPGTGFGTVLLNDAMTMITVDESWAGLTAPATVSHIHSPGAPGTSAPVLFPFTGVPAVTSGAIPEQSFAITPAQVAQLQAGLMYFNVHTANFPGGEIRGQIFAAVPEPASLGLIVLGCAGFALARRKSRLLRKT